MSIEDAATAQNKLGADIEQLIETFKEANPAISLDSVNVNTWNTEGVRVTSTISINENGARITRATEQSTI